MTATFGDLTQVADRHLRAAQRADLAALTSAEQIEVLIGIGKCVRAVDLLWLALDRTGHTSRDLDPAWNRAGVDLTAGLTIAVRCLARIQHSPGENSATVAALRLEATAVAIGASHDLLATHSLPTLAGALDRTGMASIIDSPIGRRAVAQACGLYLPALATMSETLGMSGEIDRPTREASLRAAAALHNSHRVIVHVGVLAPPRSDLLPDIRLVEPLRLHRVRDDEMPGELLRQALRGIERLHRVALAELGSGEIDRHSPGAMASVAVAMATTHSITSRLLRHIAPAADAQLGRQHPDGTPDALSVAASASARAAESWTEVRLGWRGVRGMRENGPSGTVKAEASDLVTRVGRLAHDDPAWLPQPGASRRLRPVSQLCPDPQRTERLLEGLGQLTTGSWLLAHDHVRLVAQLASRAQLLVPTRSLPQAPDVPRSWVPAPQPLVDHLRATLSDAWASTSEAVRFLDAAEERNREVRNRPRAVAQDQVVVRERSR